MSMQTVFNFIAAIFGAYISYAFGGWSDLMGFFLLAMAIDYATGVAASLKEGRGLNSSIGYWGLAKKGLMLLIIMLAHRMDLLLGDSNVVMSGAIYFYLANELISITENYGRIGLPLPKQVSQLIQTLKNKGDVGQ